MTPSSIAAALCGLTLFLACSIDDRQLSPEEPPTDAGAGGSGVAGAPGSEHAGSSSAGAGAGASAAAEAGQAGAGGADGGAASFEGGCADLNRDDVSDCTQTLLQNPAFTSDVLGWLPESDTSIIWDPLDLLGATSSGSALITSSGVVDADGNNLKAATQCVTVHADKVLDIYASARIDPSAIDGAAALSLWFFPTPDCPGDSSSEVYLAAQMADTDKTVTLHGTQAVPSGMVSLRVRLSVIKPFKAASFSVRFDNLLLLEH